MHSQLKNMEGTNDDEWKKNTVCAETASLDTRCGVELIEEQGRANDDGAPGSSTSSLHIIEEASAVGWMYMYMYISYVRRANLRAPFLFRVGDEFVD